ncbi:MAG: hypothetical protein D6736_20015, partial [Nitrospinota bacterium]
IYGLNIEQIAEVLTARENLAQELEQILQMLAQGQLSPAELGKAERNLEQLLALKEGALSDELRKALETLRSGDVKGAQEILKTLLRQQQLAEDYDNLKKAEETLQKSAQTLGKLPSTLPDDQGAEYAEGGGMMSDTGEIDPNAMRGTAEGEDDMAGGWSEGDSRVISRRPGSASGPEKEGARQPLEDREGSPLASKIEGQTGEGDIHRVYIKALPLPAQSSLPLEEVMVRYRQSVEEMMVKEDIPLPYREYIRNYFLAIGLVEGSDGKE